MTTIVLRVRADAAHDPGHDNRVFRPIDAGNPEADGCRHDAAVADRLGHHVVQDLLDVQLTGGLKIGASGARFGDETAVLVRQVTHGLRATRVDAQHVNHGQRTAAPGLRRA